MKKIIVALVATAFAFGACTPTTTPVTVSLSTTSSNQIGLKNNAKEITLTVTNSTAQAATINWERTETTPVAGWTYMVNNGSAASGSLSIAANSSSTVTLSINPNNVVGTGVGTLKFYDAADQSSTLKTFTYNFSSINSYFSLSPVGSMTNSVRVNDPDGEYHVWIKNDNTIPVTVTWRKTGESANPSAWTVAVCTLPACYDNTVYSEVTTVPANDSIEYKAIISHNATLGTGGMTALFYIASDSANSVMNVVHAHTVNP